MDKDSKFTRDEDGYVAVRTVSAPYSSGSDDKDSMFTRDEDGYVAVRVTGSGGGDQHNLGYYATLTDLQTAYPTAEAGDWAIVNTTDTVWIWDTDNSEWVDSDQKGQVISVNNKTGTVVLTAEDVNAIPQYSTVPAASSTNVDDIIQYTGTTSGSYTNGYFYKNSSSTTPSSATASQTTGSSLSDVAVVVATFETQIATSGSYVFTSDGTDWSYDGNTVDLTDYGITYTGTPVADDVITVVYTAESTTYAWTRIDVQPTVDPLPDQTGNAGKFLVTDGTSASWSNELASMVNNVPGKLVLKSQNGDYAELSKSNNTTTGTIFGISVMKQQGSQWGSFGFKEDEVFFEAGTATFGCNGMFHSFYGYSNSCTLGYSAKKWANVYTKKLNNGQDITVPAVGGALALQIATMPTAGSTYEGTIYQFTGTTDSTYTNGHFYKCVSDGQTPATYSWEEVSMGGGSSLPSQTGNSGKFLTTNGTDASWGDALPCISNNNDSKSINVYGVNLGAYCAVGLGENNEAASYSVAIGKQAVGYSGGIGIGYQANKNGSTGIAIGYKTKTGAYGAIQLGATGWNYPGYQNVTANDDANTFKVANRNGNYEMMSADGTIPTDRFTTTPVADGTYVPTLTISSGVATRSWSAPSGGGSTGTTVTLAVNDWSSNTQTVSATGVTSSNNVIVAPAPSSQADYTAAGIICTAQGAGTLTFTCTTVPSSAITVNVLII